MGWKNVKEHYGIGHLVHVREGRICIGSPYIPEIISIDPQSGAIIKRYGDTWAINDDLRRYQSEFDADPAKLRALVLAPDSFVVTITVYTFADGEVIEAQCEELGWPNVTHAGELMYENVFSADRAKAVRWAQDDAENWVTFARGRVTELEGRLAKARVDHLAAIAVQTKSLELV